VVRRNPRSALEGIGESRDVLPLNWMCPFRYGDSAMVRVVVQPPFHITATGGSKQEENTQKIFLFKANPLVGGK